MLNIRKTSARVSIVACLASLLVPLIGWAQLPPPLRTQPSPEKVAAVAADEATRRGTSSVSAAEVFSLYESRRPPQRGEERLTIARIADSLAHRGEIPKTTDTAQAATVGSAQARISAIADSVANKLTLFNGFGPVKTSEDADRFFGQSGVTTGRAAGLTLWGDKGAVYADLVSANFWVANAVFSGAAAAAKETSDSSAAEGEVEEQTALQQFVARGGNASITLTVPLYAVERTMSTDLNAPIRFVHLFFQPILGLEIPALGGTQRSQGNFDLGATLYASTPSNDGNLRAFGYVRGAWARASESVAEALKEDRNFSYGHLTAGIDIGSGYVLAYNKTFAGPRELRKLGGQITIGVLKKADKDTDAKP